MLVLSRGIGEEIIIGDTIRVCVVAVEGGRVRLGIEAPASVRVDRKEVRARRLDVGRGPVQARSANLSVCSAAALA